MKDVFYTILVVWIIWRIMNSVNSIRGNQSANGQQQRYQKEGETTVDFVPPIKNKIRDDEGEYVDYEEIKK